MLATRSNLQRHLKFTHGSRGQRTCIFCEKVIKHNNLYDHLLHHIEEKPWQCDLCNTVFATLASKNSHMMTHTREKPHTCKRFRGKNGLRNHYATHMEAKPCSCIFCGSGFNQGQHLRLHILCEIGEKAYSCNKCHKDFVSSYMLKNHSLSHEPGKYKCNKGGQVCKSKGSLKRHERNIH